MTIVEKIIASIQSVVLDDNGDPLPVYYHDEPMLNLMTSRMDFPCVLFQLLTSGMVIQEGGQVKEQVSAAVFFVERSEFDFDALQNEQIIDRCKKRAFAWVKALNNDPLVELERLNRSSRIYDQYDDILTGFGVFVDLKELNGFCEEYETPCTMDFSDDFSDDFNSECGDVPPVEMQSFNDDYNEDYQN